MPATTIFLLIGAFILSLAFVLFQYFYKAKGRRSKNTIFATLRFIAVFALLLLLINPEISSTEYYTEKPVLVLAVDNSSSIKAFEAASAVSQFVDQLKGDRELQERFEIETYTFGKTFSQGDSLTFEESQTNLSAVLKNISTLYDGQIAPVLLITDGNQTMGEDPKFAARRFDQPLLPVVVGDTAQYRDLSISRVNVNKYAFLNNRFPVEVMVNYSGDGTAETRLEITRGNSIMHSQELLFSSEENSKVVRVELLANTVGIHNYEIRLSPLEAERILQNNSREFAIQVIDERTKVLIAYSVLHPDLGAIKKSIESNQQREAELKPISEITDTEDYQLVILYQPDSRFRNMMETLEERNQNYFLITGPQTDWDFLNRQQDLFRQEITNQSEEFFPVWNENFSAFQTEDIGYSGFSPLEGNFGDLSAPGTLDVLLFKEVQGVETQSPLMGLSNTGNSRVAFLFGSDIWRWRSTVFLKTGSFEKFDSLISKFVQFLASKNRQERLIVQYEPLYNSSDEVILSADYFDQSYNFDPRADLELQLRNKETGAQLQVPFLLRDNSFEVDLSSLPAGEYGFTANVSGENLSRAGEFRILDFDVEKQFARANLEGLQQIAAQKGQQVYFLQDFERLKNELLSSDSYAIVQKSREKDVSLIDWKYLLGIIFLALGAEWFLRKYYGLI